MLNLKLTKVKKPNHLNYKEGETYKAHSIGGGFFKIIDAAGEHILAPLQGSMLEFEVVE